MGRIPAINVSQEVTLKSVTDESGDKRRLYG